MLLSFGLGGCKQFTSCKRSREHVRQARELSDGFNWNIPFKCRRLKPWFDFFQRILEEWKSSQTLVLGGRCSGNSRGNPWNLITSLRFVRLPSAWPCHGRDSSCWLPALLCPSLSSRVCSISCPLSQWCHPTISSSVAPFSSSQSFPASGSFPMTQLFASGGQSCWSFSFNINPSSESSGLISFKMDWLDLLAVQRTLKSLL